MLGLLIIYIGILLYLYKKIKKNNNLKNENYIKHEDFEKYEKEFIKNKDYVINYYKENSNNIVTYETTEKQEDFKKYYKPKRYLISKNELNFYTVLLEIAKELDLILFSQVSLYNILETKPNLDYKTKTIYFNKINRKSIDFVLVDKNDCRIKLCIELDDSTHRQKNRKERDNFINELFQSLEINLLRYPSYQFYYKDTLKRKIQENIKDHYYID